MSERDDPMRVGDEDYMTPSQRHDEDYRDWDYENTTDWEEEPFKLPSSSALMRQVFEGFNDIFGKIASSTDTKEN